MRVVIRRVLSVLAVGVLTMATALPVTAQSSATVEVTGAIVAAPLSLEIIGGPVAFGNMDYRGTAQSGTVNAQGFLVPDNGAQWVATTPFTINVESPNVYSLSACVQTQSGLSPSSLYLLPGMPATATEANTVFTSQTAWIPTTCGTLMPFLSGQPAGAQSLDKHLGTWVHVTDTPRTFTATIQFTVSG